MARSFTAASTNTILTGSISPPSEPCTLACWFKADNTTTDNCLVSIGQTANGANALALEARDADIVRARTAVTGPATASTTTTFTTGTWHHACAVFTSSSSRDAYIDGGSKGSDTSTKTMSWTPTRVGIGVLSDNSLSNWADADIAEVAVWSVALSDGEVAALAGGVNPLQIQPQNLFCYFPLHGISSPEPCLISGVTATVTGASAAGHSPGMIFVPAAWWGNTVAAAGGAQNRTAIEATATATAQDATATGTGTATATAVEATATATAQDATATGTGSVARTATEATATATAQDATGAATGSAPATAVEATATATAQDATATGTGTAPATAVEATATATAQDASTGHARTAIEATATATAQDATAAGTGSAPATAVEATATATAQDATATGGEAAAATESWHLLNRRREEMDPIGFIDVVRETPATRKSWGFGERGR